MLNDLRFAARVIRKYPLSNAVIVFTIACLVAVIGLMFATFRMNMGQQLPFKDPEHFVRFWRVGKSSDQQYFPADMYHAFKRELHSFTQIGAMTSNNRFTMTGSGEATTLTGARCTASVLEMTGMKPLLGRLFSPTDELEGNREIVILNEKIWAEHFASDPEILEKTITLNDRSHVVVGVVPKALHSTHLAWNADLWLPHSWPEHSKDGSTSITIVGLIKSGLTPTAAQAELEIVSRRIEEARPKSGNENRHHGSDTDRFAKVAQLDKYLSRGGIRTEEIFAMVFAFTLMGCVVLIACFNMMSLFLVQATSRAREMAVRLSVGATRGRIVRQMLLESVVLSLAGGGCGVLLSFWLLKLGETGQLELRVDPLLCAIAFGSAIVIGALVSILPAWKAGKADLSVALKDGGQSSASRQRHRLRNFLVGSQVGMATILTTAAVLFTRSFLHVHLSPMEFAPERLIAVTIDPESRTYTGGDGVARFAENALGALEQMPGVERAAVASTDVLTSWNTWRAPSFRDPALNRKDAPRIAINHVSPEFCDMIGITLQRGRPMSANRAEVRNEALVNETFVRRCLPEGVDPIGRELLVEDHTTIENGKRRQLQTWTTITGVVKDRNPRLVVRDAVPEVFISALHPFFHTRRITALVETKADAKKFGLAVRETLKRLDKNQPIGASITVGDVIERQLRQHRVAAGVFLGMAGFGIFMALMGVWGVVAYSVIERTREMGIRMALGATRAMVVRMIMKDGARLLVRGLVFGILIAYAVTHGIPGHMVQHVSPRDPLTYLLGFIAIALCGTLAALLPARKMVSLNPSEALHHE